MDSKKVLNLIQEIESNLESLKEELEDLNTDFVYEYEEIAPYVDGDDDIEYYDPEEGE